MFQILWCDFELNIVFTNDVLIDCLCKSLIHLNYYGRIKIKFVSYF